MNDWASFALTLDDHRRAYEKLLTNYPPAQLYDAETADEVIAHLRQIVRSCAQTAAFVKSKCQTTA